jgi:nucleotide-binding universal stress UspA family protein
MTYKILMPLDRTDYSLKIMAQVEKLVASKETEIIVMHVVRTSNTIGVAVPTFERDQLDDEQLSSHVAGVWPRLIYNSGNEADLQRQIEEQLMTMSLPLKQHGYKVRTLVTFGLPADEILNAAATEEVDLIAMTTHAREGLQKLFFGSVAEKVLHHTHTPILLVHPSQ